MKQTIKMQANVSARQQQHPFTRTKKNGDKVKGKGYVIFSGEEVVAEITYNGDMLQIYLSDDMIVRPIGSEVDGCSTCGRRA